jgi:predicted XRE-type DNA-binding protein
MQDVLAERKAALESDAPEITRESNGLSVGGTGDLMADMGLTDVDPQIRTKLELAGVIRRIVKDGGMTQAAAAKMGGVDQGDLSKIMRGQVIGYSVEKLLNLVVGLGGEASITLRLPSGANQTIDVEPAPQHRTDRAFAY